MNTRTKITIGVSLVVFGLVLICSDYFQSKKHQAYESIIFELSNMPVEIEPDSTDIDNEQNETLDNDLLPNINFDQELSDTVVVDEEEIFINDNNYIGRLEIPSINLVKGFVSKDSSANNVNKNIAIMTPSDYPDVENGNFILAAHNGNGWNSYFKNLYKLNLDEMAYVYYNGVKYTYKITKIYKQEKTGTVKIYRNLNKTTMTLITCTKGDKTTQTIFILELQSKENI